MALRGKYRSSRGEFSFINGGRRERGELGFTNCYRLTRNR